MAMHQRMVAKLKGYLWPLSRVEQEFPARRHIDGRRAMPARSPSTG